MIKWPAHCPDFTPFENLWDMADDGVQWLRLFKVQEIPYPKLDQHYYFEPKPKYLKIYDKTRPVQRNRARDLLF